MDSRAFFVRDLSNVTCRKSKRSFVEGSECVEVADLGGGVVALRDSKTRLDLTFGSQPQSGRPFWRASVTGGSDR